MDWSQKGININGGFLSHLRFADDIVLMSTDVNEIRNMLVELTEASQKVGLKMNLQKTQIMSPNNIQVTIDNQTLQVIEEYVYLDHNIRLGKNNQTIEINRRIGKASVGIRALGDGKIFNVIDI